MPDTTEVILARIETKLDRMLDDVHDHEGRIRSLERAKWAFAGVAAFVGAGGGLGLDRLLGH
jgi:hypothetical protein